MNAHNMAVVQTSTVMNLDQRYYVNAKSVKIQRQATTTQLEFAKFLRKVSEQNGMRIIYEIDDIPFKEDIPEYNKYKPAFESDDIRRCACEIMSMCDEITVTCNFMRDYFISKTGNKNITVVPNFMPKFWLGHYYDLARNMKNYEDNKKKPRILYAGSGAHFDVENRVKHKDDFEHVNEVIRKTVDKYQWVFLGAFPLPLLDLVQRGKVEFHQWKKLFQYGQSIYDLKVNMLVAPLQDNNFNKAKSDLKYIEACAFGLPIACQDICTYENAPVKFKTGDEMIDRINETLKDSNRYKSLCKKGRAYAETRWLENDENIGCHVEHYSTPFQDPSRKYLKRFN